MTPQTFDHERLDVYRLSMKAMLHRIVAMLTRMAMKFDGVAEFSTQCDADVDYDYEHRFAEHEHDTETKDTPGSVGERLNCYFTSAAEP